MLAAARNAKSSQQCCWKKRVAREILCDGFGKLPEPDGVCGQRVVAHHGSARVNEHEWRGDSSSGILPGLLVEVAVEFWNAAVKTGAVVTGSERFYPIPGRIPIDHR